MADLIENQIQRLQLELQLPYPDILRVEKLIDDILKYIKILSDVKHSKNPELSVVDCQRQMARSLIPPALWNDELVFVFLLQKEAFAIVHEINSKAFDQWLQIILKELATTPDIFESEFNSLIKILSRMSQVLQKDEWEGLHAQILKIFFKPDFPSHLLPKLLLFIPANERPAVIKLKSKQWETDFFTGLERGQISAVQNCLVYLSNKQYWDLISMHLKESAELKPYLKLLKIVQLTEQDVNLATLYLIHWNYFNRLIAVKIRCQSYGAFTENILAHIEQCQEYGMALHLLFLLEWMLKDPLNQSCKLESELILALEKNDFEAIEHKLDELGIEPWELLPHGQTLIGFAAKKSVLEQSTGFFENFLLLVKKRWENADTKQPWQKVMKIIEIIAEDSHDVFAFKEGKIFSGTWKDSSDLYLKVMKIFLPNEEHGLWRKYCPDVREDMEAIEQSRRAAFQGSQESYGLWFHLCAKAALEAIVENQPFSQILSMLGYYRKLAAFCMANLPLPKGQRISFGSKIRLMSEGPLFHFGELLREWESNSSTLSHPWHVHYLKKVSNWIEELKKKFPFRQTQIVEYQGWECVLYPWNYEGNQTYAISCPIKIEEESVTATHILWNWPPLLPFFAKGSHPFTPKLNAKGIFLHASGSYRQKIDEEIERLFAKLISGNLDDSTFQKGLCRFLYLFFQSLPFKRGSASVGIILMNAILILRGKMPPDYPSGLKFPECEAMCSTEDEFAQFLSKWLEKII